jgi:hypothetical protein
MIQPLSSIAAVEYCRARRAMVRPGRALLAGRVEVDETYAHGHISAKPTYRQVVAGCGGHLRANLDGTLLRFPYAT